MSGLTGVDLRTVDTHWLKWAVPVYIKGFEYYSLTNQWVAVDLLGRAHVVPARLLLDQDISAPKTDTLPLWIFRLYLDSDWPKATGNMPRWPRYDNASAELTALNDELDIYRGVVPTPKGYKANPARVKLLMQRIAELNNGR